MVRLRFGASGGFFACMSLELRFAALEVAPHALTLSLLCGEKMHEDCEGVAGILPLNTELSSKKKTKKTPIHL